MDSDIKNSDIKLAVVVRDDLATWQRLNVTAYLASGLATRSPDAVGKPYVDGDGREYLPMLVSPVLVYAADQAGMDRGFERAQARRLSIAIYAQALFATSNDSDNRAAVESLPTSELKLAGFAVAGPRRDVDKALDRLRLHP